MLNQQLQHCHVPDCRIVGETGDASGVCRAFAILPVVHRTQTHNKHVTAIQQHFTVLLLYLGIITNTHNIKLNRFGYSVW